MTIMGIEFGEPIATYTRAQAIEDDVLVDVSGAVREYGFRWPVALTASVHADLLDIPASRAGWESYRGRLCDLLGMTALRVRTATNPDARMSLVFLLTLPQNIDEYDRGENPAAIEYRYDLILSAGDNGEPVLTVCRPWED